MFDGKGAQCGGRDHSHDPNAPKTIVSTQMTLFSVSCVLPRGGKPLGFLTAFAVPDGDGTFLFLETGEDPFRSDTRQREQAWIRRSVFPDLAVLTADLRLAERNGDFSFTHGLPRNFGGSVRIEYASGEQIRFSDNQSPILTSEAGERIADLFRAALREERIPLPPPSDLTAVRFAEERADGGFTHAELSILPDGTGIIEKEQRFSDPKVYRSRTVLAAEAIEGIKTTAEENGVFAWKDLPENGSTDNGKKTLTFTFRDGTEISVPDRRVLPDPLRDGFFRISFELTKH